MRYANEGLVEADAHEVIPVKTEEDFQYTANDQFGFEVFPPQVAVGKGMRILPAAMWIRVEGSIKVTD